MKNLIFLGKEPCGRVILMPDHRTGYPPQLWFRWNDDWVREEWCGRFNDGEPRPPWEDDSFLAIWEKEGPDAARDKNRYDLTEQRDLLSKNLEIAKLKPYWPS